MQVDAFSAKAFGGNPAAVCLVHRFPSKAFMQNLAIEMNLSETAFVEPAKPGPNTQAAFQQGSVFNLRWFTLDTEVLLCGHATLASAAVLFQGALHAN